MNNEKKEKLLINIVLALFIAGIICCFTLYPLLSDTVSAEELSSNAVLNFNQIAKPQSYSNDFYNFGNLNSDGYFSISLKNTSVTWARMNIADNFNSTHKYYFTFESNSGDGMNLYANDGTVTLLSNFVGPSIISGYSSYQFNLSSYFDSHSSGSINVRMMCVDLTQCFGSGNEPSTVEEFKSYFVSDYYSYTQSTLVPLNATTSYSKGYTDGMQSFSIVNAGDDFYSNSYYLNSSAAFTYVTSDHAPYYYSLVPFSSESPNAYLVFPMQTSIPANSNFSLKGFVSSYVHDSSGTLNIYALASNKEVISLATVSFSGTTFVEFSININVPFGISNICFSSTGSYCLLGDVTVSYKISNLDKLAQDNYDAGRASRDTDVTTAYDNGFRNGLAESNPYTFNALFGAVFDAPIQALTGLLDFDILGVNMKGLYLSLFTLALIIFVIKLCLGKV